MFEKATRMKLRFETTRGALTTEDLWDLPLLALKNNGLCLNEVAKGLNRELKLNDDQDFVTTTKTPAENLVELKLEIVKHIIAVKLAEADSKAAAAATRAKKDRILAILADKEDESLRGKTAEELRDMVNSL